MASLALSRCSSRAIGSRQAAAPRRLSAGSNARRVAVRVAQVEAKNSVKPGKLLKAAIWGATEMCMMWPAGPAI